MKKVVFFLALTLFSALSVTAQTKYTSAVMTNSYVSHPDKTPFDTWGAQVANHDLPAGVYMVKVDDLPARRVVVLR